MAGGAVADLDDVLSLSLQGEVFIEGGHAVHLGHSDIQHLRNALQDLGAEIFVLRLDVLHDGNQMVALAVVGVDDLLHTLHRDSFGHSFHTSSFRFSARIGANIPHIIQNKGWKNRILLVIFTI